MWRDEARDRVNVASRERPAEADVRGSRAASRGVTDAGGVAVGKGSGWITRNVVATPSRRPGTRDGMESLPYRSVYMRSFARTTYAVVS